MTYRITEKQAGLTVKAYICQVLGYSSRSLKKLKYHGQIAVNGTPAFANVILHEQDELTLVFPQESSEKIMPEPIPLDVLYEDESYLCVNKPADMAVHPSANRKSGTLAAAVLSYYGDVPFVYRVLTRLDADTSGVVVIAKNVLAAAKFDFSTVKKEYLAVCTGIPKPLSGTIDMPIARTADSILKREVNQHGKPSVTHYQTLDVKNGLSLVKVQPVTGRTHQIRVHMSSVGCPLYGDFLYGEEVANVRTCLHCYRVSFPHFQSGQTVSVCAPVPKDFVYWNSWDEL